MSVSLTIHDVFSLTDTNRHALVALLLAGDDTELKDSLASDSPVPAGVYVVDGAVANAPVEQVATSNVVPMVPAAPVAPVAPVAPAITTPEGLNTALVNEFNRLGGNREPIDAVLQQFGVTSVSQLQPAQYQSVIDRVRAL